MKSFIIAALKQSVLNGCTTSQVETPAMKSRLVGKTAVVHMRIAILNLPGNPMSCGKILPWWMEPGFQYSNRGSTQYILRRR